MGIKSKYFEVKTLLREDYCRKVALNDPVVASELNKMAGLKEKYQNAFSEFAESAKNDAEYQSFVNALDSALNSQVKSVLNDFSEYEKAHNEKQRIYHHFTAGNENEALDSFRNELLQHLAGSIVVKEHRLRYQKEQFDRFIASMQYNKLWTRNQTLRDFCTSYANMIEILIEDSFNDRSPKIEANYDDFQEKTLRPLNATIFYYFFSADKRRKTFAQWLLSSVRYPNERVRRAYMRFFAWTSLPYFYSL